MIQSLDPSFLFRAKKEQVKIPVLQKNLYENWTWKARLGTGSSGQVDLYRKGKQRVAIKTFIPKDRGDLMKAEDDFYKELASFEAADMHNEGHVNVVKFKAAFINDTGFNCIALEYCKRGALSKIYEEYPANKYTEEDIRSIIMQCCSGLQYLLERKIVHRDIKNSNILVRQWKPIQVCLADLNVASRLKDKDHSTVMNTKIGTKANKAPEIGNEFLRNENNKYNHKVDIFSLGIVAYELFTFRADKPELELPKEINEQIIEIRRNNPPRSSVECNVIKEYFATFNNTGMPLLPAIMFENMSDEARYVVSRMLLFIYTARIDYEEILKSDWATKDYSNEKPLKSIKSYLTSIDAVGGLKKVDI